MTTTPNEPVGDDDIETVGAPTAAGGTGLGDETKDGAEGGSQDTQDEQSLDGTEGGELDVQDETDADA